MTVVLDVIGGTPGYTFGKIASVAIGGSMIGGRITTFTEIASISIKKDLIGGAGTQDGCLFIAGNVGMLTIGGDVIGGDANQSGSITLSGKATSIKIAGNLKGGAGSETGALLLGSLSSNILTLSIGGSIVGGAGHSSGGIKDGNIATLTVGGNIIGGNAINADDLTNSGYVTVQRVTTMTVGGSVIAGIDNTTGTYYNNGVIRAANDIGSLTIKGSVVGNATNLAVISARGQATPVGNSDVALGKLTVVGRVEFGLILGGTDAFGNARNADAQIGSINVLGDWIASSAAAGTSPAFLGFYGNPDDVKMSGANVKDLVNAFSKIGSVTMARPWAASAWRSGASSRRTSARSRSAARACRSWRGMGMMISSWELLATSR